jgi:hypothetical protein
VNLAAYWSGLFELVTAQPRLREPLLAAGEVRFHVALADGVVPAVVPAADVEVMARTYYGMGLREFVAAGGVRRLGARIPRALTAHESRQRALDRLWAERYRGMAPVHRAGVDAVVAAGVELPVAVQVFVGCAGDRRAIAAVLDAMR